MRIARIGQEQLAWKATPIGWSKKGGLSAQLRITCTGDTWTSTAAGPLHLDAFQRLEPSALLRQAHALRTGATDWEAARKSKPSELSPCIGCSSNDSIAHEKVKLVNYFRFDQPF